MLEQELLSQGTDLMIFGMGTVFVFLTLLVLSTNLMSLLINRFFPEPEKTIETARKKPVSSTAEIKPEILAAIQMAIKEHKAKQ